MSDGRWENEPEPRAYRVWFRWSAWWMFLLAPLLLLYLINFPLQGGGLPPAVVTAIWLGPALLPWAVTLWFDHLAERSRKGLRGEWEQIAQRQRDAIRLAKAKKRTARAE